MSATPHGPSPDSPPPWVGAPPDRQPDSANPLALAASVVIPGARRLHHVEVFSTNVAAQFIHAFDLIAVPANGTVPLFVLPVAASSGAFRDFGSVGRWFDRGIVFANSTTAATLTAGAADCLFDVVFY